MLVLVVGTALAGWYAYRKMPDIAQSVIVAAVDESDLSAEDKQVVKRQVERLVQAYKQGKVSNERLIQFAERLTKSPLMDLMIAYAARVQYINESGLSDEEKAAADRTLQRLARGVIEKKIATEDLDAALDHISNELPNGGREFSEEVSDEDLRAFLAECKRLADAAEVPDADYKVDIGTELRKLVDEVLGEKSAPPTAEAPATETSPPQAPPVKAEAPPVKAEALPDKAEALPESNAP
jgi:hypothetical protein